MAVVELLCVLVSSEFLSGLRPIEATNTSNGNFFNPIALQISVIKTKKSRHSVFEVQVQIDTTAIRKTTYTVINKEVCLKEGER